MKDKSRDEQVERRERVPMGDIRPRLEMQGQDPNYVYRWCNDVKDRIARYQEAGYEFVSKSDAGSLTNDDVHQGDTDLGSHMSRVVGVRNGAPVRAYLMRIKKEWYDEDQERKQLRNDEVEVALRSGNKFGVENQYGEVKLGKP